MPAARLNTQKYVGLTEKAAVDQIEADGLKPRVVSRDGQRYMVTADHRLDRVNLKIENGRVIGAQVG